MKKCFALAALIATSLVSVQTASAGEPNLAALGLGSMTQMNHSQAMGIRGQTRRATTVTAVDGRTSDARVGGIIVIGGIGGGGGFIGGAAGVGTLSTATSGYAAVGTTSAAGWSYSRASLTNGSFTASASQAR